MSLFPAEHDTIDGVGRAFRSGETTCVEVLNKCLDRIGEWEGRVKAWVVVDRERAVAQAERLDAELAEGKYRGPLHGIPFGIKDIIDVQGLPTEAGFRPWRDRIAETDAQLVSALRSAGAVILGKTVTTQFAWIDPPLTRNPWNLERTPGGSSSGSAVAVALGMCLAALGTQTGGSIIRPAAFCGVAGYKPPYRSFSDKGIVPLATSLDHPGLIARSVRDLRLIKEELAAREDYAQDDPDDPLASLREEGRSLYTHAIMSRVASPRLLRLRGFIDRQVAPEMLEAFERALGRLIEAGAKIDDMDDDILNFESILVDHRLMLAAEAAASHEERFAEHAEDYAPRIRSLVEEGLQISVTDYVRARLSYDKAGDRYGSLTDEVDAIVTPAAIGAAPDLSTTGNPCFNSPFSYLGWPAATFPIGLSSDGLPLGIQIVRSDRWEFQSDRMLATAEWCEAAIQRGGQ